jgi:hypothetical protein
MLTRETARGMVAAVLRMLMGVECSSGAAQDKRDIPVYVYIMRCSWRTLFITVHFDYMFIDDMAIGVLGGGFSAAGGAPGRSEGTPEAFIVRRSSFCSGIRGQ